MSECRAQYGQRSPPPSAASFWVCQSKYFAQRQSQEIRYPQYVVWELQPDKEAIQKQMSSLGGPVLSSRPHKVWWTPRHIQNLMALQGIKGPSYRLIHGNTKEIFNMKMETMGSPRNLSDDVLSAVQPHIRSWTKIYGKNYLQWPGSQAQLVVMEPELCKEILSNKDGAYPKREPEGYVKKLVGDSMGTTNQADKWSKVRKLANHAFHGESLKSMIPAMIASAETMLDGWKNHEGKEIEVYEQFRTAFSSSYLEGKSFFDNLMKLSFLLVKKFFQSQISRHQIFKSSDDIESEKLDKAMRDFIIVIVKKREKATTTGEENKFGNDYLGLLLKAHLDTNDLVDECKAFYFAGQETSNGLLAWIIFLLALHTDWQEEARKEVLQLFGKQNPTHDDISKLKTMSMIINESLRLYPSVLSIDRKVTREVKLGRLIVPANVELLISCLALHHEPEFWGKTCTFLNHIDSRKIALSMILQRYQFTLSPGYVHSPVDYLTIRPQHGVQVMLHKLFLCVFLLLLAFLNIFDKLWWAPTRIQKLMALQGIKGPSYRPIHGNTKEMME
ncbi:Cytochrome P450 superfamily protein [Prunus dulcis]|uniref:Cytochrome P450 superfamily protein n=1 Tax=Prunus dulcis TaxID=3755 RepID=A0A4Y1QRD3_PRUDU|nr:Cytochrome P450 superfamily protein [Prunus dulcis]